MTRAWQGFLAALAFAGADALAGPPGTSDDGFVARIAHITSPSLRRTAMRLAEIDRELTGLPALLSEPFASRYGFRSATFDEPDTPQWLQIELEQPETIDRIVVVPVHIPTLGQEGVGYGFPRRFKIEIAEDPAMADAVTVVDHTAEDFPHPGRYPVDFKI